MAGHQCSVLSLSLTSFVLVNFMYPIILGASNQSPENYRVYPLMTLSNKISEIRNRNSREGPTETLQLNQSSIYDMIKREESESISDQAAVPSQYGDKRNALGQQETSTECEADDDILCLGRRHPRCTITFPESDSAEDTNCKIRLDCAFTCSATCFAIYHAFPTVFPATQFRFSLVTFYQNGTVHLPLKTWNGRLRGFAVSKTSTTLQNNATLGGRFRLSSSFNCSSLVPCTSNLDMINTL